MKKLVVEDANEGFISLLGETIEVWCLNYIYAGTLVGVNDNDIKLENAYVVYDTGALGAKTWVKADRQPHPQYIRLACIESYSKTDKAKG